jgi:7-cyano-7-deazaguanine reductase
LQSTPPFFGVDIWNAYELAWLNLKGKPQIALAEFIIPADSPNMIESKSFKLYLNSLNQHCFADFAAVKTCVQHDLSQVLGTGLQVRLVQPCEITSNKKMAPIEELGGQLSAVAESGSYICAHYPNIGISPTQIKLSSYWSA